MTRKEHAAEKREAKIKEWLVPFTREYEMARAYGRAVNKAVEAGIRAVNKTMQGEWEKNPTERSFLVDVKLAMRNRLAEEAIRIEGGTK